MEGTIVAVADALLARSVDAAVTEEDRATASHMILDLLAVTPGMFDDADYHSLESFLSCADTAQASAGAAVARALSSRSAAHRYHLLGVLLARPGVPLVDIEPFMTPATAAVLAAESDRPEVLQLVFASIGSGPDWEKAMYPDSKVLASLAGNAATSADVRVQAVVSILNRHGHDLAADPTQTALRALSAHPGMAQPVFDALDLPPATLMRLCCTMSWWDGLAAAQLDRLTGLLEQALAAVAKPSAWLSLKVNAEALLWQPNMTPALLKRVAAAVGAAVERSAAAALGEWCRELSSIVQVLTAPNRAAALVRTSAATSGAEWYQKALRSAPVADIVEVLTDPGTAPNTRRRLLRDMAAHMPAARCTPELLALLPMEVFRRWTARGPNEGRFVDAACAAVLFARCGTDRLCGGHSLTWPTWPIWLRA